MIQLHENSFYKFQIIGISIRTYGGQSTFKTASHFLGVSSTVDLTLFLLKFPFLFCKFQCKYLPRRLCITYDLEFMKNNKLQKKQKKKKNGAKLSFIVFIQNLIFQSSTNEFSVKKKKKRNICI